MFALIGLSLCDDIVTFGLYEFYSIIPFSNHEQSLKSTHSSSLQALCLKLVLLITIGNKYGVSSGHFCSIFVVVAVVADVTCITC